MREPLDFENIPAAERKDHADEFCSWCDGTGEVELSKRDIRAYGSEGKKVDCECTECNWCAEPAEYSAQGQRWCAYCVDRADELLFRKRDV